MFQHRHYVVLANTLAGLGQHNVPGLTAVQHAAIIKEFAEALRGTNPNFNYGRFCDAAEGKPSNGRDR